jgi:hypothetical protein
MANPPTSTTTPQSTPKAGGNAAASAPSAGENAVETDANGQPLAPPAKPLNAKDVAKTATEYMVPFSAQAIRHLLDGKTEVPPEKAAAFEMYLKQAASGLYPQLASQINSGLKTAYLLDPYRQAAKQVLGQQFEPNFQTDAKSRAVFSGQTDPVSQRPRMMTIAEWTQYLKTNPAFGWAQTPQGQAAQQQVLQSIGQGFNQPQGQPGAPPAGGNQ